MHGMLSGKSLRPRLIFLVLLALLPGIVLAFLSARESRRYARIEAFEQARRLAVLTASNGRALIESGRHILAALSLSPPVLNQDPVSCLDAFRDVLKKNPQYRTVLAATPDGSVFGASPLSMAERRVTDDDWFRRAMSRRGFTVGLPLVDRSPEDSVLTLAYPVYEAGSPRGVVALTFNLDFLDALYAGVELPAGSTVSVVNAEGAFLHRIPSNHAWEGRNIPEAERLLSEIAAKGADAFETAGIDGVERLYAFAPILADPGNELYVRIGIPASMAFAEADRVRARSIFFLLLVAGATLLATASFGRVAILRPVKSLLSGTRRLAAGDLGHRVDITGGGGSEIAELGRSFNDMAASLEARSRAIEASERRFRDIFDHTQEGIFQTTTQGRPLSANPALAAMLGYESPSDLLANVTDIPSQLYVNPGQRAELVKALERDGRLTGFEIPLFRKDGSLAWLVLSVRLVKDEDGSDRYLEGFASDISGRKKAEAELTEAKTRLERILEHSDSIIHAMTPEGVLTYVSPAIATILGYEPGDIVGQSFEAVVRQEDIQRLRGILRHIVDNKKTIRDVEHLARRKDGQSRWLSSTVTPVLDEKGRVDSVVGLARDIDAQKRAEAELAARNAQLQGILDHSPSLIYVLDAAGRFRFVNRRFEETMGVTNEELKGRFLVDLHGPEIAGECEKEDQDILASGQAMTFLRDIALRGGTRTFLTTKFPLPGPDGRPSAVCAIAADVTERERLGREVLKAKLEAEQANAAKSDFLARMSHEIRTPLNAVMGMTEMCLSGPMSPEQRDYLKTAREAAEQLLLLVNDILDLSKIEAGRVEMENLDYDPRRLCETVVRTYQPAAGKKGLVLNLDLPPDTPACAKGDPARVRQILVNLVGNALKFTPEGHIDVKVAYRGPDTEPGSKYPPAGALVLSVADTGIGIPSVRQKDIFEPFLQADGSITRVYGGTGLGLSICRELVARMGGSIRLSSQPGAGSVFTVTLPFIPGDPSRVRDIPFERSGLSTAPTRRLSILLVEDNPINVKVALAFLTRLGHTATVAQNGLEAIAFLTEGSFDLALMDLEMPLMDGFEATRRIRAGEAGPDRANVPVVAMTAHAMYGYRERCLEAGMTDYLTKPLTLAATGALLAAHFPARPGEPEAVPPPVSQGTRHGADPARPYDPEAALSALGGDTELLDEITVYFASEIPARRERLRRVLDGDDLEAIRREAHSLKGPSGSIGAFLLAELTRELEYAARDGERRRFADILARLDAELDNMAKRLEAGPKTS